MRLPIPLKRRAAWLVLVVAIPILLVVAANSAPAMWIPGYWTWTVARSVLLLIVSAAVASTAAALEAARLRKLRILNPLAVRNPIAIVFNALWPPLAASIVLQAVAVGLLALSAPGGTSALPVELLAAILTMLLFQAALGFALGSLMHPVVSIPLALIISYSWLGFTGTIEWMPLRHLAGLVLETCCMYDQQLSTASALAVSTFSLIASCSLIALGCWGLRLLPVPAWVIFASTGAALAVAAAAGLTFANDLGPNAVAPRDSAELQCTGTEIEVCLFPEQRENPEVAADIERMFLAVQTAGVNVPQRVEASMESSTATTLTLRYVPWLSEEQLERVSHMRGRLAAVW